LQETDQQRKGLFRRLPIPSFLVPKCCRIVAPPGSIETTSTYSFFPPLLFPDLENSLKFEQNRKWVSHRGWGPPQSPALSGIPSIAWVAYYSRTLQAVYFSDEFRFIPRTSFSSRTPLEGVQIVPLFIVTSTFFRSLVDLASSGNITPPTSKPFEPPPLNGTYFLPPPHCGSLSGEGLQNCHPQSFYWFNSSRPQHLF